MIYQKLSEIQKKLFVPKGQKNNFGGYNYRSCEDIFKAVKPICEECGCVLTVSNDMEQIGDRNYVKAIVILVELETGEKIESTAHAREEKEKKGMDGSQITGAASSYARKYALAGLFCIDNEKDSDATNQGDYRIDESKKPIYIKTIKKLMNETGTPPEDLLDYFKCESLEKMTVEQLLEANKILSRKKEKLNG